MYYIYLIFLTGWNYEDDPHFMYFFHLFKLLVFFPLSILTPSGCIKIYCLRNWNQDIFYIGSGHIKQEISNGWVDQGQMSLWSRPGSGYGPAFKALLCHHADMGLMAMGLMQIK